MQQEKLEKLEELEAQIKKLYEYEVMWMKRYFQEGAKAQGLLYRPKRYQTEHVTKESPLSWRAYYLISRVDAEYKSATDELIGVRSLIDTPDAVKRTDVPRGSRSEFCDRFVGGVTRAAAD